MRELIYNQNSIPKAKWRYGLRASAKVGCGWVATSNAMVLMGADVDVEKLIHRYEWQLPLIHGNAGTSFWGPALMLKKYGYSVRLSNKPREYDALCKSSDVCILFYYWRKGIKIGSHFVAVRWTEDGVLGYNTFENSTGPDHYGPSLTAFIRRQGYHGTVLIGAKRK